MSQHSTARSYLLPLLLVLALVLIALPALAQLGNQISPAARHQIEEVLQAKKTFDAAEQKMDSQLIFLSRQARGRYIGQISNMIDHDLVDAYGMVEVDIRGDVATLLDRVPQVGGKVKNHAALHRQMRAAVPLAALYRLAQNPNVSLIQRADRAVTNVGSLTSQGYISHAANQVIAMGINGTGIKIGVLSDSASPARVAALIASGDLGPDTVVLPGQAGSGNDEGTAMMEIVHDLAPGAQLYFATAFGGTASFANNITALAAAGCSIIVDDVTYFAEPAFQDGPIAQAINDFVAGGGIYFSSAANSGNKTLGTSGTWEGDYLDGGAVSGPVSAAGEAGNFHNFNTTTVPQNYDVLTAATTVINLKWSDPRGSSTNDYDLFILNSSGTTVTAFSAAPQSGTQDPYEAVSRSAGFATNSRIVVVLYSGAPRALRVDTNRGRLSINTPGSTFGHNAGANTVTVAATYWNSAHTGTRPFVGFANPIESFSSDGPRWIFYYPNGSPITPGNYLFATNGGTTLQKPDITAADGVACVTPGFLPFFGTSAAAPHAAAIAALVKQANPTLTNTQVVGILKSSALDNMAVGADRDGGSGIVMANRAVNAALGH